MNRQQAREVVEKVELGSDENIISLDVNSFYTNVPLNEAIDIVL